MNNSVLTHANCKAVLRLLSILLFPFLSFAQPANDNCGNAKLLTSSANTCAIPVSGTVIGATDSGKPAGSGCNGNADDDVWYMFVAQGTSSTVSLSGMSTANNNDLGKGGSNIEVFSSSDGSCTNLTYVTCIAGPNKTSLSLDVTTTMGTTYYVRVFSKSNGSPSGDGSFSICVTHIPPPPPPGNDDCASATLLTYNNTKTSETVSYATSSGTSVGSCTGNPDDDVWYKFIATSSSAQINLTNVGTSLSSSGANLQVFSGSCGSFTSIGCGSNSVTVTGLTTSPSTTYYIRVYSAGTGNLTSSADFDITVTTPPVRPSNDECTGAITLNTGTTYTAGTVFNATTSAGIPTGCTGTPDDDVWFKYTPISNSALITLSSLGNDLSNSGARFQLFSGTCGSLTSVSCGSGTTTLTVNGLTIGNPYYIRVYSNGTGSIGTTPAGSAFSITVTAPAASRMNEVFKQTVLDNGTINKAWEITYGPDDYLWITGSQDYKAYRMDPNTGAKTTILDITNGSATSELTAAEHSTFNVKFNQATQNPWPQGGFAGLAIHPEFNSGKPYVYISYVYSYGGSVGTNAGYNFTSAVVRFTYNTSTNKLTKPVFLCDTIPGSGDHNSQRLIIAPVNGTNYLFMAVGDMGAGQLSSYMRNIHAQDTTGYYEGKILRFNLEDDGDAGSYDKWIPNDNPYNRTKQSAIWAIGMRNNQGFAYNPSTGVLYGSSHGAYSDDEINIIERYKNYGHPLIQGYASDGNYNGTTNQPSSTSITAGETYATNSGISAIAPIGNEATNAATINASGFAPYKDPLFSAYPSGGTGYPTATRTVAAIWGASSKPGNAAWPSEGWSGLDVYNNTVIPGWKNSLLAAGMKWGRILRLKLDATGKSVVPSNGADTIAYWQGPNGYRDIAFAPNGKDIFVSIDRTNASGPAGIAPPATVTACDKCIIKYTFLGYADASGKSTIPASVDVTTGTTGTTNTCEQGNTITIDNSNNNLWVPITGPDGNILAEIKANGNNLGTVSSSFYLNDGTVREDASNKLYLDRNITITPQTQPTTPVDIRLYLTQKELADLSNAKNSKGVASGVSDISKLAIFKNDDLCGPSTQSTTLKVVPTYTDPQGSNGFVLQAQINSFSTFYFASNNIVALPLNFLAFNGTLQNNAVLLQWETANEISTSHFVVERSIDGSNFTLIGTVAAAGNSTTTLKYSYVDNKAMLQPASKLYYRLKQVDQNGSYTYSKTITIALNSDYTVTMHPNPITDVLKVKLSMAKSQHIQVHVTDINGRTVYTSAKLVSAGNTELQINTKAWPPQSYSVRITGVDNKTLTIQNVIKL